MSTASFEEETLDLIYGAAVQPSLWTEVLKRLRAAVGGERGTLTRLDIQNGTGSALMAEGEHEHDVVDAYFAHFYSVNPLQLVDDPSSYVQGWRPKVLLDEDWMPREALERSEYYNDFLRPIHAEWGLLIRLGLRGSEVAAIGLGRGLGRGRFDPAEISAMTRLQPHLVRAFALSERFAALETANSDLASALDLSPSPALLVDGDARILHGNAAAERLISGGSVLRALNGRLSAADPRAVQPLAGIIARAAGPDWERRSGGSVSLRGVGRPRSLTVTTSPLRLAPASVFAAGSAVLVCVTDPGEAAASPERLAERHGLTAAESRLAVAVIEGVSLRGAADRFGVSIHTVRAQLAGVFAKTRTHRQVDLVRLLLKDGAEPEGLRP